MESNGELNPRGIVVQFAVTDATLGRQWSPLLVVHPLSEWMPYGTRYDMLLRLGNAVNVGSSGVLSLVQHRSIKAIMELDFNIRIVVFRQAVPRIFGEPLLEAGIFTLSVGASFLPRANHLGDARSGSNRKRLVDQTDSFAVFTFG